MTNPDLLVVLGKNIGIGSSPEDIQRDPDHLSDASRVSALAAGILFETLDGVDVLYSTGVTADDTPAESAAMRDYTMRHFPEIPANRLHTEELSRNTAGNAKEVADWLGGRPEYEVVDLATVGYHKDNAVTIFNRNGVAINGAHATDEVLREHGPMSQYPESVGEWLDAKHVLEHFKERVVRRAMLATIDRDGQGRLLDMITQQSRASA